MRTIMRLGAAVLVLAVAAGGYLAWDFHRYLDRPAAVPADAEPVTYTIEPGTSVRRVASALAERDLIADPLYFRVAARWLDAARRIKAGEYVIEPGRTPRQLLQQFVAGEVKQYAVTVIEGWTFEQMLEAIRDHDAIAHQLSGLEPGEIMRRLGHPDQHPEGRFYPDTYHFPRGTSDRTLLERSHERMQTVLEQEWRNREEDLPLDSAYEALILASIIERETAVPDERDRIAGVFVERLERGMRLQTDPTVIYGLGDEFDGDLTYKHLRTDTPYNTYTRGGLPPTPIALPSRPSIHAALHPERRGELYFVSTGDGRHVFSKTLDEHNEAVVKYQLGGDRSRLKE